MPVAIGNDSLGKQTEEKTEKKRQKQSREPEFLSDEKEKDKQKRQGKQPMVEMKLPSAQAQNQGINQSLPACLVAAEKITGKIAY